MKKKRLEKGLAVKPRRCPVLYGRRFFVDYTARFGEIAFFEWTPEKQLSFLQFSFHNPSECLGDREAEG